MEASATLPQQEQDNAAALQTMLSSRADEGTRLCYAMGSVERLRLVAPSAKGADQTWQWSSLLVFVEIPPVWPPEMTFTELDAASTAVLAAGARQHVTNPVVAAIVDLFQAVRGIPGNEKWFQQVEPLQPIICGANVAKLDTRRDSILRQDDGCKMRQDGGVSRQFGPPTPCGPSNYLTCSRVFWISQDCVSASPRTPYGSELSWQRALPPQFHP